MKVLVNSNIPTSAKDILSTFAEVVSFSTEGITYPALSGHADIFFLPGSIWTIAPNLPGIFKDILRSEGVLFCEGRTVVDATIRGVSAYNAAVHPQLQIANTDYLDSRVLPNPDARTISVRQGLCRCTTIILDAQHVITSDGGIAKILDHEGVGCLLVDSSPIMLPGYRSGCFGGCCGIEGDRLFVVGSLSQHPQGDEIRNYVAQSAINEIVELYSGPLFDVGSLLFF